MMNKTFKIYLSGAISGIEPEEVTAKFKEAEKLALFAARNFLPGQQARIVNPLDNGLPDEAPWAAHMVRDIELLLDCDAVLMIEGWTKSKGARVEHYIAYETGKHIIYE